MDTNNRPFLRCKNVSNKELASFKRIFTFYLTANELDQKEEKVKVAHLRMSLDEKLNDIIDNANITAITVEKIFDKLKTELMPKENVAYNQFLFFDRKQQPNESFNEFYMEIKALSSKCNFENKTDEILKCQIVHGVSNAGLKERLYRTPDLDLQEVVNYCRASEDAKLKLNGVGKSNSDLDIDAINMEQEGHYRAPGSLKPRRENALGSARQTSGSTYNGQGYHRQGYGQNQKGYWQNNKGYNENRGNYFKQQNQSGQYRQSNYNCNKCNTWHGMRQCPAYGRQCKSCGRYNHYTSLCRNSRRVRMIHGGESNPTLHSGESDSSSDCGIIESLVVQRIKESKWTQAIKFKQEEIVFKIDTGADINVLTISALERINPRLIKKIKPYNVKVHAFGGHHLQIIGNVQIKIKNKNISNNIINFAVMEDGKGIRPILGHQASVDLCLVKRVNSIR
uniref:Peptidase A2 domain-containing protein n=2 Tax=Cacopsylla melanoneura TaxID=428564 RepID=A0A8D9FHR1_9HEMI